MIAHPAEIREIAITFRQALASFNAGEDFAASELTPARPRVAQRGAAATAIALNTREFAVFVGPSSGGERGNLLERCSPIG